jgi:nucleoside phosphorylase
MASWTFSEVRAAARSVRRAELGRRATDTIRSRAVFGLVSGRAPLSILLYVATRDRLVVTDGRGGFAVLQPPLVDRPSRRGGFGLRTLRRLDRNWDLAVLVTPPVVSVVLALALLPFARVRVIGAPVLLVLGLAWVAAMMTLKLAAEVGWLSRLGGPSTAGRGRAAQSLPGSHWSVPLVHQPDPTRMDALIRALLGQLHELLLDRAHQPVAELARLQLQVTETPVFLVTGITTSAAREALGSSPRVIPSYSETGDVIVLQPPSRPDRVPRRPISGGGFLGLYVLGVAVVLAVTAQFVSSTEASACARVATTCATHPATYRTAVRWLLQRLLFTDPPGLSPFTLRATVLGWLVSLLSAMGVVVLATAARQEIRRNHEVHTIHEEAVRRIVQRSSVLILVVAEVERDAVLRAAASESGRPAVAEQSGRRTVYSLGPVGEADLYLTQAGEQGNAAAAGLMVSALQVIPRLRPDYVVLTGICYGLRPEEGQRLGDIVVARRVQGVDHRKVGPDGVIPRGVNVGCSPLLLDRFQAGQVTWPDQKLDQAGEQTTRVHIGTVLTSNTLVDNLELVERLRKDFPDAIAGEMEGTGVYEATTEEIKPDWIMVKAISDWGYDMDQGRIQQAEAAGNAADFVLHVLATAGLPTRREGAGS